MDSLNDILQHLIRFSPDALIVVDERSQIRFANDAVKDVLGYAPDELVDRPLETLVPERLRSAHARDMARYLEAPRARDMAARVPELAARRRDGSEFPASIRLAPFRMADGGLYVAAAIRDVTEQSKVNEALVAAREEADRANRAKSRFLATASHDLRQPLQTIRLLNAAMLKVVPQSDLRELLSQQNQAIESMTRLLNALLDISRLESGAVEPKLTDVPLADVFADLRTEFASIARARNLSLHFDAPTAMLSTDRTLFYQLLQNLVGNSLKYTDVGCVRVACSLDEHSLTISIEDTGVGIPEDKIAHIFDEYYQVDTHGAKRMGVGLGLAIVKEVARLLGYSIQISSRQGQGTQAKVAIPAKHILAAKAPTMSQTLPAFAGAPERKARLILVEDHDGVRQATELFLRSEGFDTLSASSTADAEKLLADLKPGDIVIADYHLDGQRSGLDLLLELRKRVGCAAPGVILSGDLPSVLRSLKAPIEKCRFLSKPVDATTLLDAIAELSGEIR
ncbi:MAG TPA: ATP-binding protein [Steroidobacter sp.]|jgi:PAS domain S-box-containing protein|nr:ATP-binding protein [Steroidobacter sp.]